MRKLFTVFILLLISLSMRAQTVVPGMPALNAGANQVISDGSGGYYVTGSFTTVGGATHNRLVHIKSDNSVDATFNTSFDGPTSIIVRSGSRLYVAGSFANVAGTNGGTNVARAGIAAIDLTAGSTYGYPVTAWGASTSYTGANGSNWTIPTVISMAISTDGTALYIGGAFTTVNGVTRNNIAALSTTDGSLVTTWNPNANGFVNSDLSVRSITPIGSVVYVAGDFANIGGVNKPILADLNASNGQVVTSSTFLPNPNSTITQVLQDGSSNLYVSGIFTSIGGQSRSYVAHISTSSGAADAFTVGAFSNGGPYNLLLSGTTLYIGGFFTSVGGTAVGSLISVNSSTGALLSCWNPNITKGGTSVSGTLGSILLSGSNIIIAGGFDNACGEAVANLQFVSLSGSPKISSITPSSQCANTSGSITISGINFYSGSTVKYRGSVVSSSRVNNRTLTVTIPSLTAGSGSLTVSNTCGTDSTSFNIAAPSTITGISPSAFCASPTTPTTPVTVTGTNFTAASTATYNGSSVPVFYNSATSLTLTIPSLNGASGNIIVTTPPCGASNPTSLIITAPTSIVVGTITGSPFCAGQTFSVPFTIAGCAITGCNVFTAQLSDASGSFASAQTIGFVIGNVGTSIPVTLPSGIAASNLYKIQIIASILPSTSAGVSAAFTVNAPPTITTFSPNPALPGTTVTITGTGFTAGSTVKFGTVSSTSVTVVSSTSITATVPAGAPNAPIVVTTTCGTATSCGSFNLIVAPTILSFTPTAGPVLQVVAITGTGFVNGLTTVAFNGTAATGVNVLSSNSLLATVATGTATGPGFITISNPGTTPTATSAPSQFTVYAGPTIAATFPSNPPHGTSISITGSGFTGVSKFTVGGRSVNFTVYGSNNAAWDNYMLVELPSDLPVGQTQLCVYTPGGQYCTSSTAINITAIEPGSSPVGNNGSNELNLDVYPNPASDVLHVTGTLPGTSPIAVSVTNAAGLRVHTEIINPTTANLQQDIDLSGTAAGVYLVQFFYENKTITKRVVIK